MKCIAADQEPTEAMEYDALTAFEAHRALAPPQMNRTAGMAVAWNAALAAAPTIDAVPVEELEALASKWANDIPYFRQFPCTTTKAETLEAVIGDIRALIARHTCSVLVGRRRLTNANRQTK